MKKIFLFNGPAGSGKDTAVDLLESYFAKFDQQDKVFKYKMAYPMKVACHALLGLEGTLEELEPLKPKPVNFKLIDSFVETFRHQPEFARLTLVENENDLTLREFYIYVSENVMKPLFGQDVFGRVAVEYVKNSIAPFVTISDSGFAPEAQPLINYYGKDNVILTRIHRPDYEFAANDSRGYIELPGVTTYDINNDSTLEDLEEKVLGIFNQHSH